jgi:hypothetical protein
MTLTPSAYVHDAVFGQVRNMRPDFPFVLPANNQSYFSDGYCVLSEGDVEFIALNTVIDQIDEVSAKRGTFSGARIEQMETVLSRSLVAPLRIPICFRATYSGRLPRAGRE